jgi:hypothetical protein
MSIDHGLWIREQGESEVCSPVQSSTDLESGVLRTPEVPKRTGSEGLSPWFLTRVTWKNL